MARGCALIDSRLDTAKIGSDGRVEVHRARLLAVFGGTKNGSTRPGSKPEVTPLKRQVRSTPQKRTSSGDSRMSVSCQSRPKCAAATCAGDHLIDTNMRHSEAKHPGGLMVDDNSNLADCTAPRLGVGAALSPLGRTHDAFDHHGRDAREHGLGHRGCQDVGNRT